MFSREVHRLRIAGRGPFFKPKAYSGLAHLSLWWIRRIKRLRHPLVVDADDWEHAWNEVLPYKWHYRKMFAWQEDWGLASADAVTVASRALERLAIEMRQGARGAVHYLPNGCRKVSAASAATKPSAQFARWRADNVPIVLLYSRFLEFRLERIVDQIRMVSERLPRARWLIVGEGLYGEHRRLAQQISAAGLDEFVHFAGWVPADDLDACFSMAGAAIFPYDDNLINRTKCSVKLIDLLASGVPVVADAVGQKLRVHTNGISGQLVEPEDDVAMANMVIELLSNPEAARAMGHNARSAMIANFNWADLSEIAEQTYVEAIEGSKNRDGKVPR
jgi:glycosyltransferase involved in cell wall biosynthesis